MDSPAEDQSSTEEILREQTVRLFSSVRWIGPVGSAAAALTIFWIQQDLVNTFRLRVWLLTALSAAVVNALAVTIPFLIRWKTKRKLSVVTEAGHALLGISAGGLAFVDMAALADSLAVQMSTTSYIFAMTLGVTRGVPSLGPLAVLSLVPMWLGMIVGFGVAGHLLLMCSLCLFAGLVLHGIRQDRLLWAEIVELRTASKAEATRRRIEAQTDPLTGLLNRAGSAARLGVIVADSKPDDKFSVLYIDLDRFKEVNDQHGHAGGDLVLMEVAERLRSACRKSDVLARVGGDEFVIVSQEEAGEAFRSNEMAERIAAVVSEVIVLPNGVEVSVTGSVGWAEGTAHKALLEDIVERADRAMYRVKLPAGEAGG